MTQIFYNGINPFSGISPTPLVSRREEMVTYNNRWGQKSVFTLDGVITGACGEFDTLYCAQKTLLSGFGQDFQSLQIIEDGNLIFSKDFVRINSIQFPRSNYVRLIPYSIEIECYPEDFFSGYFGVINPENEYSFSQQNDGIVNVTHKVSAQGFNTSAGINNSLENAHNYVSSLTGQISVLPFFINHFGISPCLISYNEELNRIDGTYAVTENYIFDSNYSGSGILRYSTTYDSGIEEGISQVSVEGTLKGCRNQSIESLRRQFSGLSIYNIANQYYLRVTNTSSGSGFLNPEPTNLSINEQNNEKNIGFNWAYDNDPFPKVYLEDNVSLNTDQLTNISEFEVSVSIRSRGDLKDRWARVSGFYDNFDFLSYCYQRYGNLHLSRSVNPSSNSRSIGFDQFNGQIDLRASFDNNVIPPSGFKAFDYSLDFVPGIRQYSAKPCLDASGHWYIVDLNFRNRARLSIKGSAVIQETVTPQEGVFLIKNQLNIIANKYISGVKPHLDNYQLDTSNAEQDRLINFNTEYSYEGNVWV